MMNEAAEHVLGSRDVGESSNNPKSEDNPVREAISCGRKISLDDEVFSSLFRFLINSNNVGGSPQLERCSCSDIELGTTIKHDSSAMVLHENDKKLLLEDHRMVRRLSTLICGALGGLGGQTHVDCPASHTTCSHSDLYIPDISKVPGPAPAAFPNGKLLESSCSSKVACVGGLVGRSESELMVETEIEQLLERENQSKKDFVESQHEVQQSGGNEAHALFKTRATSIRECFSHSQRQPCADQQEATLESAANITARRYFDALEGPEFDSLKDTREMADFIDNKEWPFLLRFPITCFSICLGLGNQTILWKTLSSAASMHFMHIPKQINTVLWYVALAALLAVFTTYTLKCLFYFEAVRREFYHPVRINYFFVPWIACMFLTVGVPPAVTRSLNPALWVSFMVPIFLLELKIYGQWLLGGKQRLAKVANPTTHLSVAGNFVGALLAAMVGWREFAIFFWAVGLAHYFVLLVTLYQRLPTAAVLPKELHPVYFLLISAPSTASVAWSKIVDDFDLVSRIAYFIGLFLYLCLVVRVNFFRGFRFSVSWWTYTSPMTASAIATIHYSLKIRHPLTQGLAVVLSLLSSFAVVSVCLLTIVDLFLWCTMFPNDMAITIARENGQRGVEDPRSS